MTLQVLLFGCLISLVSANGLADVVLSCHLVEEGVGLNGERAGSLFTRTPATLVLREVTVFSDLSPEMLSPFVPPSVLDPDLILFEAKASSLQIPNGDVLLHAECNEQGVACEISRYSQRATQETADAAYFVVSVSMDGEEFGSSFILQTLPVVRDASGGEPVVQSKLGLPLSQSGTLLTEVVFLVFSPAKSVSAALRSDVLLTCGFRQKDVSSAREVAIEWRLQHRGKGQSVLEMTCRLDETADSAVVHTERPGSHVSAPLVASENNASVTLSGLKVSDEGTYICSVRLGLFHAQQVIQLQIIQPPHVSLSGHELELKPGSPLTLSCHCSKFYPLDAQMEWLSLSPSETEPQLLPYQGSLTSHRQHSDGTLSQSSHLTVPASVAPGTTITCRVSHVGLSSPLSVSMTTQGPEPDYYWLIVGFLAITVLFCYQILR